jgi:hypothetical protein
MSSLMRGSRERAPLPAGGARVTSLTGVRRAPPSFNHGSVGLQPADEGALRVCDPVTDDPESVIGTYHRSADRATLGTPASETYFKAPACRSESA